jgi:hypothetical protein
MFMLACQNRCVINGLDRGSTAAMPVISAGLLPLRGSPSPFVAGSAPKLDFSRLQISLRAYSAFGNELRRIALRLRLIGLAIKFERRRSERIVTLNAERVATSQPSNDDPPS